MEDFSDYLDTLSKKFTNCKSDVFNNSITTKTIKQDALTLKELITKLSENETFSKMLKSEDVKSYYEEKYTTAMRALEKLENERQALRPEKKIPMVLSENITTPRNKPEKKLKFSSKMKKMDSVLQEITNKKDLMDLEETHFVGLNEYGQILNEIKAFDDDVTRMEAEKVEKSEKIAELERKGLSLEAEVKQTSEYNENLRKLLEEKNHQSASFQTKINEIESQLKKDSERLSLAQHKNFFLQKIYKELVQNYRNIEEEIKAKIATPENSDSELNLKEYSNEGEVEKKTPLKSLKKISCFEENIQDDNTIVEVFPSHEQTMQSLEIIEGQRMIEPKDKKQRDCGCFDFVSILKIC